MNREEVKQLKAGNLICLKKDYKPMECLKFRHFTGFTLIETKCGQTVSNWEVQSYPPKHNFNYQTKRFMNSI